MDEHRNNNKSSQFSEEAFRTNGNGSSISPAGDDRARDNNFSKERPGNLVVSGTSWPRPTPGRSHEAFPGYTHPQQDRPWYAISLPRPMDPSGNYRGRSDLPVNQPMDISENENTSLWITNLPPHCNHGMLLQAIRNCGSVYATVINPPLGDDIWTAACKLVFFERHGVDSLLAQHRAGTFKVMNYTPCVMMNRKREMHPKCAAASRVLRIRGPSFLVNTEFLLAFFQSHFSFNLDEVLTLSEENQMTDQEWRFGSFCNQAEVGYRRIVSEKNRPNATPFRRWMWSRVEVEFGPDPCGD